MTGVYEQWVTGLRRWGADPTTDLSGLPALDLSSFTPDTYTRLMTHLNRAVQTMMDGWTAVLTRTLSAQVSEYDRSREWAQTRRLLARRGELAALPAWPAPIADALRDSFADDVRRLQRDLEHSAASPAAGAHSLDRGSSDRLLTMLRQSPLTAVLTEQTDPAPSHPVAAVAAASPRSTPARRVFFESGD